MLQMFEPKLPEQTPFQKKAAGVVDGSWPAEFTTGNVMPPSGKSCDMGCGGTAKIKLFI